MNTDKPLNLMWRGELKQILPNFKNIHAIKSSNVVMHVSPITDPVAMGKRIMLGGSVDQLLDDGNDYNTRITQLMSNTNPTNPFSHTLLKLAGYPGKLLVFQKGNMIRNGKYIQAEHFSLIVNDMRYKNKPWHGGIAVPNTVVTVIFKRPVDQSVKFHARANKEEKKYPGISIISKQKIAGKSNCTPVIYTGYNVKHNIQNRSKAILAGVKSPRDTLDHLTLVDDLSVQYPSRHPLVSDKVDSDEESDSGLEIEI